MDSTKHPHPLSFLHPASSQFSGGQQSLGKTFLLWQSASKYIMVFATSSNIRLLETIKTWGTDGTFKIVFQ
ncbi:hypothetical protein T12_16598 [Trichinella patagoniensis]|uniref:Uncharacterized protein n=1 Tax=Trichinella patagoniensis TaxID=990121 RepID=A0A0V0ZUL6_9BILA|nr:hypothetical protein T12_16598 [Trichinella patagoniensis]